MTRWRYEDPPSAYLLPFLGGVYGWVRAWSGLLSRSWLRVRVVLSSPEPPFVPAQRDGPGVEAVSRSTMT